MLQKIRLSVCDMREPLANSGFFSRIYLCHLLVHGPGFLVKKKSHGDNRNGYFISVRQVAFVRT